MHLIVANSLVSGIGSLFHPIFALFATLLAWIYALVPNYAVAIALLTILIMAALTPLTVKSTRSMLAMQRLQPEMKKLQAKYKGPENREQLNQELMKLYKEAGVNPASSCIPMFLQMPFFIVLYDMIKGLTNTVTSAAKSACSPAVKVNGAYADPRYIPHSSKMFEHLCASGGKMPAFGMNLALKPTSYHPSVWAALPYYGLVLAACALQFVQMAQMNRRNPGAMQANPQMRNMQYFMPIIFAVIYVNVQSAVVIYMIVSTMVRIATQDVLFRTGLVQPASERQIGGEGAKGGAPAARPGLGTRLRDAVAGAAPAPGLVEGPKDGGDKEGGEPKADGPPAAKGKDAASSARPPSRPKGGGGPGSGNGKTGGANGSSSGSTPPAPKAHPRSRSKRTRKAR